jgi:putative membrane protein
MVGTGPQVRKVNVRMAAYPARVQLALLIGGNAIAAWLTIWLVPGLNFDGEWWWFAVFGIVIGVVNAIVKPVAKLLTLPIRILTLGLFNLVVNIALMAALIWFGEQAETGLSSDTIWATLLGGLVLAVIASIIDQVLD